MSLLEYSYMFFGILIWLGCHFTSLSATYIDIDLVLAFTCLFLTNVYGSAASVQVPCHI